VEHALGLWERGQEAQVMAEPDRSVWFAGDLEDPWVATIADAVPGLSGRLSCAGDLPDDWPGSAPPPRALVLHRAILTGHDLDWLRRFRQRSEPQPRVVLCFGPYARYADLARWSPLWDAAVPEATALDTLARRLIAEGEEPPRPPGPRPLVCVVSALYDLRQTLALACEAAGYPVQPAHVPSEAPDRALAVWDVPVLERGWPRALAALARRGRVITLLGFADRELVRRARALGASACLELPCDLADLTRCLDQLALDERAAPRVAAAHSAPPPPNLLRPSVLRVAAGKSETSVRMADG
jgi:hypothetical protein